METQEKKPKEYNLPIDGRVEHELQNMRFIDLQRSCIIRGIPFDVVISKSVGTLQSWLIKNWHNKVNKSRLDEFDDIRQKALEDRGMTDEPFVRLGIPAIQEETNEVSPIVKISKKKSKKVRRERSEELGIFKGTKKAYVFELVQKGLKVEKIIPKVIAKFPEAKEKSVKIWFKKATKQLKKK